MKKSTLPSTLLSVFFAVLSIVWLVPIFEVLNNSFKSNNFVNLDAFALPKSESFVCLANYIKGMTFGNYPFLKAVGFSFLITVASVLLILLFCSMTAWYIVRVKSKFANLFYYLCLFSMIVPFQMVMFTLTFTADKLNLNTPYTIPVIYLGLVPVWRFSCLPASSRVCPWKLRKLPPSMAAVLSAPSSWWSCPC